jgi:tetratricopeptide (TPR) repeat protein
MARSVSAENPPAPSAGLSRFSALCARELRGVRYFGSTVRLPQKSKMTGASNEHSWLLTVAASFLAALLASPACAGNISLPPEAIEGMEKIYGGDPDAAISIAHALEQAQPDHTIGYLLEGEARWWKRYCAACEIKYGMFEASKRGRDPQDEVFLALTDKVIHLAESQISRSDSAEMQVSAGIGWALKVRVYGLRGENRNAAHAGVNARAEMLRALQLDPQMADATAALGVYNYYVDTLSPVVKLLRIFMGIPGGNKEEGIKQMEVGMNQGVYLAVDARFILARSLRTYDQKYEQALAIAEPLVARYPQNPIFQILLGNLNAELGRKEKASEYLHEALRLTTPNSACGGCARCTDCNTCVMHLHEIAISYLSALHL